MAPDALKRHPTQAVSITQAIDTPDGQRYTCFILAPENARHIDNIGSGWRLSPLEAETQARRLYALALSVHGVMSKGVKAA